MLFIHSGFHVFFKAFQDNKLLLRITKKKNSNNGTTITEKQKQKSEFIKEEFLVVKNVVNYFIRFI